MDGSETRPASADFTGVGELLAALLPAAERFDFYGDNGEFVWSSAGVGDRSVAAALLVLPGELFHVRDAGDEARLLTLPDQSALYAVPVDDPAGRRRGVLTCSWPAGHDPMPPAGEVAATLAPALALAAELRDLRQESREAVSNGATPELDLLYELDETLERAPHSQAQLARLVRSCARHLGVGYSVLILPSKQIRISATHPSWKGADRGALDKIFIRRFLPSLSSRRSPSVLKIAQLPGGVEPVADGYQILLCPLREGGKRVNGVLALAGRIDGSSFGRPERRFASLIARRAERVIESNYDPLTGLVNRGGFEAHLREGWASLTDDDAAHAVVIFDIDKLQLVNDTFGHGAGDDMLRRFAGELKEALPEGGVASRLSGDNFGVLLHDTAIESAVDFAENVRRRAQKLRYLQGDKAVQISVSAGVAACRRDSGGVSGALVAPKVACTAAKEHGRDRVEIYDPRDHSIIRRADDIRVVVHLHNALERGGFALMAQPIASLARGGPGYHEILVRMCGDDGESLLPESFLSAAERYQLMPRVDRWVVEEAIALISRNRDAVAATSHRFAINLSGQSLGDDDFLDFVREQVRESGLAPGTLCFEITETAAVANLERARSFMETLRSHGCRFSLDDFGAGLSSFAYLKNFDVDALKIDGSFVRDVAVNRVSEAMVAAITQVARVMDLETVAEYVTSEAVLRKVTALGVDYAQGYHIGEPVPLEGVLDALGRAATRAAAGGS